MLHLNKICNPGLQHDRLEPDPPRWEFYSVCLSHRDNKHSNSYQDSEGSSTSQITRECQYGMFCLILPDPLIASPRTFKTLWPPGNQKAMSLIGWPLLKPSPESPHFPEGEDLDAFHVRSTYVHLSMIGVRGSSIGVVCLWPPLPPPLSTSHHEATTLLTCLLPDVGISFPLGWY
jgi:hypothetical protein